MAATKNEEKQKETPLLDHLKELMYRVRRIVISLGIAFFIFFGFGIKDITWDGFTFPILYPSIFDSVSVELTRVFIYDELPKQMKLLPINPFDPIFSSITISMFLATFFTMPIIVREIWAFVSPGLYEREKRVIKWFLAPSFILFAAGASFAYFVLIPFMLRFVILYVNEFGGSVLPTLGLKSFISLIMTMLFVTGISFEFPLVMDVLTYIGAVKASTWKKNWRWGVLGAFIIAWIISPGTTGGVIETVIGLILSALFFVGVAGAYLIERNQSKKKEKELRELQSRLK
ncbi:twin-arginine translocase subunit TatC [Sulfuracidifex metallicus]|uniref:Sec-independent protein translocase protein TatC n=1 Tax=Sulfuracidifex metallicus DSM 6482 = JCM 9184 TaxID=523847 RepID=A0A6A9QGW0_SULME|nr:twin-arginine translocase subunit TatC [Sulfuracidifex metallicus]MUN28256.1 twin-arginine translocase subunit TatC [Sulfuracidifex metallicus DSM 6482 = JCM 9184]WOE51214.1 twin-arginine translocase subunit TatC [Sulfuracidifex metallicus DSM 6482 = JCM 9184]